MIDRKRRSECTVRWSLSGKHHPEIRSTLRLGRGQVVHQFAGETMRTADENYVNALLYGAELVDDGWDYFPDWSAAVMREYAATIPEETLKTLYALATAVKQQPRDEWEELAWEAVAREFGEAETGAADESGPLAETETVQDETTNANQQEAARPSEPRDWSPLAIHGKRFVAVRTLLLQVLLALLVLASPGFLGGVVNLFILTMLGMGIVVVLVTLFRPPFIEIAAGKIVIRYPIGPAQETGVDNVKEVGFIDKALMLRFIEIEKVTPETAHEALRAREKHGYHVLFVGNYFRRNDADCLRSALGIGPSDGSSDGLLAAESFEESLREKTPFVFVTPTLLATILAVFVCTVADGVFLDGNGAGLIAWGANLRELTVGQHQWWRLVTSMFLHWGLLHLLFNFWVLKEVGPKVERLFGNLRFLLLYMTSGVAGSLCSAFWHADAWSVGASGAIFGLFGGLIGYTLVRGRAMPDLAMRGIRRWGIGFVTINVILGMSSPQIDMACHLGGLAGGFFCSLLLAAATPQPQLRRSRDLPQAAAEPRSA